MDEIIIQYMTTSGLHKHESYDINSKDIFLDLRDIAVIDLTPLIWCLKLEELNLRNNKIQSIDLTPLRKCLALQALRLDRNLIYEIDLSPLNHCIDLEEIYLSHNLFKQVDLSPLFFCPRLKILELEASVVLNADIQLRSNGTWPMVLLDKFHRIHWQVDDAA
ncbi:MAG: hypothetical protein RTU09_02325 [Candidatus Thorarchaeota archaeon]